MASNYFKQTGPCFNAVGACNPPKHRKGTKVRTNAGKSALGDLLEYAFTAIPPAPKRKAVVAQEYPSLPIATHIGMGADPTVDCDQTPNDIVCQVIHDPSTGGASADPQTAYTACLKGGGSFASCNQIPGVTPEMILAAKAGSIVSPLTAGVPSIAKTALFVGAAGLALYLLTR